MARSIEGQVVVLTGAAGGLGRALARELAGKGARLVALDLPGEALDTLAAELDGAGHEILALGGDITDEAGCDAAISAAVERFGGVDVLINNAGISQRSAFADTDVSVFRQVMEVNLFGAIHCTRAALSSLIQRRGRIVAISSVAGIAPLYGRTGYAASKHAMVGLFSSLRTELAGQGVGVTIVCPTFIDTGIEAAALDRDGNPTTHPRSTMGKGATAEEVAATIVAAIASDRDWLFPSAMGRAARVISALAPSLYERIMTRSLRHELQRPSRSEIDGPTEDDPQ